METQGGPNPGTQTEQQGWTHGVAEGIKEKGKNLSERASEAAHHVQQSVQTAMEEGGNTLAQSEGRITKGIEHYTSRIPSGTYLTLALGSMAASAFLHMAGRRHDALFVGQWAPAILIMGLYNKLVKLEGSD